MRPADLVIFVDGSVHHITIGEAYAFFHWYCATYWIKDPPRNLLEHIYTEHWIPMHDLPANHSQEEKAKVGWRS